MTVKYKYREGQVCIFTNIDTCIPFLLNKVTRIKRKEESEAGQPMYVVEVFRSSSNYQVFETSLQPLLYYAIDSYERFTFEEPFG